MIPLSDNGVPNFNEVKQNLETGSDSGPNTIPKGVIVISHETFKEFVPPFLCNNTMWRELAKSGEQEQKSPKSNQSTPVSSIAKEQPNKKRKTSPPERDTEEQPEKPKPKKRKPPLLVSGTKELPQKRYSTRSSLKQNPPTESSPRQ